MQFESFHWLSRHGLWAIIPCSANMVSKRVIFGALLFLSPGQTDRQVVASGRKLNFGRDLRWVAKRTYKFPRKYTQVAKKTLYADSSISLANNRLIDVTQLALIRVEWPNGENSLALTCVQIWSRPKWAQVIASQRKPWPNGVASRPKFSTCVYLRFCLARAFIVSSYFLYFGGCF